MSTPPSSDVRPRYFPVPSPVFKLRFVSRKGSPHVLYCGGGGSSKSGVRNTVVLASLSWEGGEPKFETKASADTGDKLCVSVAADADVDLVAAGMHGGSVVVYGCTAQDELVALTEGLEADLPTKDDPKGEDSAVECMALHDKQLATGGNDGVLRVWALENQATVLSALQKEGGAKEDVPKLKVGSPVECKGHRGPITDVAFDAAGARVSRPRPRASPV